MSSLNRKKTDSTQGPRAGAEVGGPGLHQRIAEKAYELFLRRGSEHGHDMEDWLEAERIVSAQQRSGPRSKVVVSRTEPTAFLPARQRSL